MTPETCRVTLQWNKSDCILLHLVGLLFNTNCDARNLELKIPKLLPLEITFWMVWIQNHIMTNFLMCYKATALKAWHLSESTWSLEAQCLPALSLAPWIHTFRTRRRWVLWLTLPAVNNSTLITKKSLILDAKPARPDSVTPHYTRTLPSSLSDFNKTM